MLIFFPISTWEQNRKPVNGLVVNELIMFSHLNLIWIKLSVADSKKLIQNGLLRREGIETV